MLRICRVCGIGIGDALKVTVKTRAGLICKFCYKEYNRIKSIEYYHTSRDKSLRCVDPTKKVCSECNKSFWTSHHKKLTCSLKCSMDRKYRKNKEYRCDLKNKM